MATLDGTWLPGIGDATPMGWLTVVAYFGAAYACWRAAPRRAADVAAGGLASSAARSAPGRAAPSRHRFWWIVALILALLGVNKQLDLQTAVTEIGRAVAQQGGWYGQRHTVQIAFIGAVGVAGVAALAWLARLSWPLTAGRALSLGGLVFLACFVVIRAASFHHVDLFIRDTVLGLRWNWIVELSGIALVAAGAVLERRAAQRAHGRQAPHAAAPRSRRPTGDDRPVVSRNDPRTRGR